MHWNRISGLWSDYQGTAKTKGKGPAQGKSAPAARQFWTAPRPSAGIQDPLVRQMDYRQRMALLKREIEEVEREVVRLRAICAETREMLQRMDQTTNKT